VLGLALTKRVVEVLGAPIEGESIKGRGARSSLRSCPSTLVRRDNEATGESGDGPIARRDRSDFGRGGHYSSVESRYVRTRVANADLASSGT
jgi:hypothetical protein